MQHAAGPLAQPAEYMTMTGDATHSRQEQNLSDEPPMIEFAVAPPRRTARATETRRI